MLHRLQKEVHRDSAGKLQECEKLREGRQYLTGVDEDKFCPRSQSRSAGQLMKRNVGRNPRQPAKRFQIRNAGRYSSRRIVM